MVSSQSASECFTNQTIPQIDINGNFPPVNPDVGGIAVALSNIIINVTLPILLCWSQKGIHTTIAILITQSFPVLIATLASINRGNLTLFDCHFAIAVTASPRVYFAFSSFRDLIGLPNTLFRSKIKEDLRVIIRSLGLLLPLLWLSVNLTTFFYHQAFLNSNACDGITVWYWLEFQFLSNFAGSLDVLGRRVLWDDQQHRGGLGTVSVTAMWTWAFYLVRHRWDIYWEIEYRNQKVRQRKVRQRWKSFLVKSPYFVYNVPAASWHVIAKSHPWMIFAIVLCFWSWVLGISKGMIFKGYQFSYGQITSLFSAVPPLISVGQLLFSRWPDFSGFLAGLPEAFVEGLKFLAKGEPDPWKKYRVKLVSDNPPLPAVLMFPAKSMHQLCSACQSRAASPESVTPPSSMTPPQSMIPPEPMIPLRSMITAGSMAGSISGSMAPTELIPARTRLCPACRLLVVPCESMIPPELMVPAESTHKLCLQCQPLVVPRESTIPPEPVIPPEAITPPEPITPAELMVPAESIRRLCPACLSLVVPRESMIPVELVVPTGSIQALARCPRRCLLLVVPTGPAELTQEDLEISRYNFHRLCKKCRLLVAPAVREPMGKEPFWAMCLVWVIFTSLDVLWIWEYVKGGSIPNPRIPAVSKPHAAWKPFSVSLYVYGYCVCCINILVWTKYHDKQPPLFEIPRTGINQPAWKAWIIKLINIILLPVALAMCAGPLFSGFAALPLAEQWQWSHGCDSFIGEAILVGSSTPPSASFQYFPGTVDGDTAPQRSINFSLRDDNVFYQNPSTQGSSGIAQISYNTTGQTFDVFCANNSLTNMSSAGLRCGYGNYSTTPYLNFSIQSIDPDTVIHMQAKDKEWEFSDDAPDLVLHYVDAGTMELGEVILQSMVTKRNHCDILKVCLDSRDPDVATLVPMGLILKAQAKYTQYCNQPRLYIT